MNTTVEPHVRQVVSEAIGAGLRRHGYATEPVAHGGSVLYRLDDANGGAVVTFPCSFPDAADPTRPLIYRFGIGSLAIAPASAPRELDVVVESRVDLEVSVLPDELLRFARWVPRWIARRDERRPEPEPPYRLVWWAGRNYAWTHDARARFDAWLLMRGRQPWR